MTEGMWFLLWSVQKQAWYRSSGAGYTRNIMEAGEYTGALAASEAAEAHPPGSIIIVGRWMRRNEQAREWLVTHLPRLRIVVEDE